MATDPKNCIAVVSSTENKNLNDVISKMIAEGTGLTRPQAMAYFEKLTQIIVEFISDGHTVKTPLMRIRPTISGTFIDTDDYFDPSRHQVNIRTTSGTRLRELAPKIKHEKVLIPKDMPIANSLTDGVSGEKNVIATSGGIGLLRGRNISFDASDVQQGIFFIPVSNLMNEVRVSVYTVIKPSEVHFQIPSLDTGEYYVTVKNLSKPGNPIRTAQLKTTILV